MWTHNHKKEFPQILCHSVSLNSSLPSLLVRSNLNILFFTLANTHTHKGLYNITKSLKIINKYSNGLAYINTESERHTLFILSATYNYINVADSQFCNWKCYFHQFVFLNKGSFHLMQFLRFAIFCWLQYMMARHFNYYQFTWKRFRFQYNIFVLNCLSAYR